ncbi:MAG: class I SAM-dependent methyltransferase [Rhodospirillum sp.]|nr:class I SAM-dependent methyltransferase [Rhodospirillum sp.]MCF8488532.1 class I SAM-dependent methyltransferase [Rhodospirillum sp.]MCF8499277.1 class I SAM-dependent methyltransferase [Rhodospirillum sp.]
MADLESRFARFERIMGLVAQSVYPEKTTSATVEHMANMARKLVGMLGSEGGRRVLDVGCGDGTVLGYFADMGMEPIGVTLGSDVEVCRSKGLTVVESDITFLDFEEDSFDLVWCRHAIEHTIAPFVVLMECARVLRSGGLFYMEVPAPDTAFSHENNQNHFSVFGKAMWEQLLARAGLAVRFQSNIQVGASMREDTYFAWICYRV